MAAGPSAVADRGAANRDRSSCKHEFFNLSYPTRRLSSLRRSVRFRDERTAKVPISELSYKSADGTQIVAYRWDPEARRGPWSS